MARPGPVVLSAVRRERRCRCAVVAWRGTGNSSARSCMTMNHASKTNDVYRIGLCHGAIPAKTRRGVLMIGPHVAARRGGAILCDPLQSAHASSHSSSLITSLRRRLLCLCLCLRLGCLLRRLGGGLRLRLKLCLDGCYFRGGGLPAEGAYFSFVIGCGTPNW